MIRPSNTIFASMCAVFALLFAAPALASDEAAAEPSLQVRARNLAVSTRHQPPGPPALRSGVGEARSTYLAGVRFWALGTGYAVGRRPAGYRLGAGAALPLLDSLSFTASYRLTGYSDGGELEGDTLAVQERVGGAFFGFDWEF